MQKQSETSNHPGQTTLTQDLVALARYGLASRTGKLVIGAAIVAGGFFLGWDWVVSAGLASLVLGVLPCAAMCVLGLCMRPGGKSCSSTTNDNDTPGTVTQVEKSMDTNSDQSVREKEQG